MRPELISRTSNNASRVIILYSSILWAHCCAADNLFSLVLMELDTNFMMAHAVRSLFVSPDIYWVTCSIGRIIQRWLTESCNWVNAGSAMYHDNQYRHAHECRRQCTHVTQAFNSRDCILQCCLTDAYTGGVLDTYHDSDREDTKPTTPTMAHGCFSYAQPGSMLWPPCIRWCTVWCQEPWLQDMLPHDHWCNVNHRQRFKTELMQRGGFSLDDPWFQGRPDDQYCNVCQGMSCRQQHFSLKEASTFAMPRRTGQLPFFLLDLYGVRRPLSFSSWWCSCIVCTL